MLGRRRKKNPLNEPADWLVVGLGNPGRQYELSRHNAGTRALRRLASQLDAVFKPARSSSLVARATYRGNRLALALPTSQMNESGNSLRALLSATRLQTDRLIVVNDDVDLPVHALRLKRGGGTAGHHGLESIERSIGTRDFFRVRIGVGRPNPGRQVPPDYLLEEMSDGEAEELGVAEALAADAVLAIISEGLDRAMSTFNSR